MKLHEYGPTRALRVRRVLQELGVEFESVVVNMAAGEHTKPELLRIIPVGKHQPVLGRLYPERTAQGATNGSDSSGRMTKLRSVRLRRKPITSSRSCSVSVKPRMKGLLDGCRRPSPAFGPPVSSRPPAA